MSQISLWQPETSIKAICYVAKKEGAEHCESYGLCGEQNYKLIAMRKNTGLHRKKPTEMMGRKKAIFFGWKVLKAASPHDWIL